MQAAISVKAVSGRGVPIGKNVWVTYFAKVKLRMAIPHGLQLTIPLNRSCMDSEMNDSRLYYAVMTIVTQRNKKAGMEPNATLRYR